MDYSYTYSSSDVSHTKAKAGDTDKWAVGLGPLLDANKSSSMSHRELIKMDTTVLDIEMKKATVTRSELEVSLALISHTSSRLVMHPDGTPSALPGP